MQIKIFFCFWCPNLWEGGGGTASWDKAPNLAKKIWTLSLPNWHWELAKTIWSGAVVPPLQMRGKCDPCHKQEPPSNSKARQCSASKQCVCIGCASQQCTAVQGGPRTPGSHGGIVIQCQRYTQQLSSAHIIRCQRYTPHPFPLIITAGYPTT